MNSEKVKEIKKCLENSIKFGLFIGKSNMVANIELADILTLINELESENRELKKYKCDWLNSEKMHLQAELEDTEFEFGCANRFLQEISKENQQLKDRIAELEKENDELKVDLKNSIDMQKEMLDGFKTATKEVEENLAREIPNLLKQFAERLKEKLGSIDLIRGWVVKMFIDETLKEFLN